MRSFNVSMPESLLDYVRLRTKQGGFGTPTEYLRHLIRKDQAERAREELEQRLLEGLKSPRSRESSQSLVSRMHTLIDRVAQKPPGRKVHAKTTRRSTRSRK